ncbi:MAG: alpha/beta fold hydrolase [Vulcanimicrobiaceae bacterium]
MPTTSTTHLQIAYEERRASAGDVVVLLHGFPDDAHTWDRVVDAAELASVRTVAPYLRGYGATRFRDPSATRSGQSAAFARDTVELLEALGIERCVLVGHDWGARAAYNVAVLAPERIRAVVALSVGYGTNVPSQALSYEQIERYWYQWYFATPRGETVLSEDRHRFCRALWRLWSPGWNFSEDEYERTAAAFENPDFVEIVLHSYRQRWDFAPGEPSYEDDEFLLRAAPPLKVPVHVLHGTDDGATLLEATEGREAYFPAGYRRTVLEGVGHFVQRERPAAVVDAIVDALATA